MPGPQMMANGDVSSDRNHSDPAGVDQPMVAAQALRHDVINSLTVALGYASMAHRWLTPSSDPRLLRALSAIEDDIRRAYRLMLRNDVWVDDDRDLRAVIGRALSQMPAQRADDIRLEILTAAPLVGTWNPLRIEQVLANLIDNAAKYSAAGSPIAIEVSAEAGYARIAVRDAGIGIGATDLAGVFAGRRSPQARAVAKGDGIGLPLCRQLVELAGGCVDLKSIPGVGSVVTVMLPLSDAPGAPDSTADEERISVACG
jgi:signal transduction histidine kinase